MAERARRRARCATTRRRVDAGVRRCRMGAPAQPMASRGGRLLSRDHRREHVGGFALRHALVDGHRHVVLANGSFPRRTGIDGRTVDGYPRRAPHGHSLRHRVAGRTLRGVGHVLPRVPWRIRRPHHGRRWSYRRRFAGGDSRPHLHARAAHEWCDSSGGPHLARRGVAIRVSERQCGLHAQLAVRGDDHERAARFARRRQIRCRANAGWPRRLADCHVRRFGAGHQCVHRAA